MERKAISGAAERYAGAAAILPGRLRKLAMELPMEQRIVAEEIRLRAGRPLTVLLPSGETEVRPAHAGESNIVEAAELETLCDLASDFSRYAAAETMREGFLPVRGGYRVGLCGTVVMKNGVSASLKNLSSAAIRIGRERKGVAAELLPRLFRDGEFASTLLFSPPGGGKTTLLRDLVRLLSTGMAEAKDFPGFPPLRVSLIDERGEIAVMVQGAAQMDVGPHTDVLDGCPKALGIPMVLRAMNPQVIAVDEITVREDPLAVAMAAGCGVRLLATVHGGSVAELLEKPLYRALLEQKVFRFAVGIQAGAEGRRYEVEEL